MQACSRFATSPRSSSSRSCSPKRPGSFFPSPARLSTAPFRMAASRRSGSIRSISERFTCSARPSSRRNRPAASPRKSSARPEPDPGRATGAMSLIHDTGTTSRLTNVRRFALIPPDLPPTLPLGPGTASDAFLLAFQLPNIFRRLFAEGAFSSAYVPMFSRRLHGEGGQASAEEFSSNVLSVFVPLLIGFTALVEIAMPGVIWVMASEYQDVPGKFELTVALAQITFPYILLISLVSLLAGILNSLSRFAPGASFPILLNLVLIVALLLGDHWRAGTGNERGRLEHDRPVRPRVRDLAAIQ